MSQQNNAKIKQISYVLCYFSDLKDNDVSESLCGIY